MAIPRRQKTTPPISKINPIPGGWTPGGEGSSGQFILHIGIIHFGEYVKWLLFSPPMEKRNPRRTKTKQALLELLRQSREEAGVLQADLARKLGRKQGFVSKYELGDRRLDLLDLADICDALGISLTEFAKRFDEKRRGGRGGTSGLSGKG